MKDDVDQAWYSTFGETTIQMHKRLLSTKSGESTVRYFDSSVMQKYQMPSKKIEDLHCLSSSKSSYCQSLDRLKHQNNVPVTKLIVSMSTVGDGGGRGVFATTTIKKGNTIGYETSIYPVYIPPISVDVIYNYVDLGYDIDALRNYFEGYGWESSYTVRL